MERIYASPTILLALVFWSSMTVGCKENPAPYIDCQKTLIIDSVLFRVSPNESFSINDITIAGNCLKVEYSHCGTVEEGNLKLIDSQQEVDGLKHSRKLRFSFDRSTNCWASNSRIQTFDISDLQRFHKEHIVLTIPGSGKTVYQY
jgi:hypothetical protein